MRRRALVTGATGFVGSHLAEQLTSEEWEIRALVRPTSDTTRLRELGVELHAGELGDVAAVRRAAGGVQVVFHLAAVTAARDEAGYRRANVDGSRALAEAIGGMDRDAPDRLVYLSSYAACGPSVQGRPRRTTDPPAPLTAYGRTKLEGERVMETLEARGIDTVVVRAPAVYGPRDRALLTYFQLVRWGIAPLPAGGERRLHMIFAPDLARALARAADAESGTYAVADPREHTWEEVVAAIAAAMRRRPLRIPLPAPLVRAAAGATERAGALFGRATAFNLEKADEMLAPGWVCDLSGARRLLPPEEATPLVEGIERTVRWYRRQGWL